MSKLDEHILKDQISLDKEERLRLGEYRNLNDNGYMARAAIWSHVMIDDPIPNELKPILQEILLEKFTGKKQVETKNKWRLLVQDVALHIALTNEKQETAIEQIALENNVNPETLLRKYKDGKYRNIKNSIFQTIENNKNSIE